MKNNRNLRKLRKTVKNKTVELLHIIKIQEGYSRNYIDEFITKYRNSFISGGGNNRYIKHRFMYLPGAESSDIKIINLSTLENSEEYIYNDIVPLLPEHIKDKVMLDLILLNCSDNSIK